MSKRGRRGRDIYAMRQSEPLAIDDEPEDAFGDGQDEPEDGQDGQDEPEDGQDGQDEPEDGQDGQDGQDEPEDGQDGQDEPEDDPLAALQAQYAALRRDRDQIKAAHQASMADSLATQRALLVQATRNAEADMDAAATAFADATKAGNAADIVKAQRALTRAAHDVENFAAARDELDAEMRAGPASAQKAPAADPFMESIKQFSSASQEWLVKNRKDLEGPNGRGDFAVRGHHAALGRGITPDTPEYFDYLDRHMGYKNAKATRRVGKPQRAAPGGAAAASSRRMDELVLTPEQREMAARFGMSQKSYAKQLLELRKNGQDPKRNGPRLTAQTAQGRR